MRLMEIDPEPMDKIRIKYIAYYAGKPVDEDNLTFGMKPALDALTEYGLIKDDSPEYVKGIEVEYHRVKHRKHVGLIMDYRSMKCTHHYVIEPPDGSSTGNGLVSIGVCKKLWR